MSHPLILPFLSTLRSVVTFIYAVEHSLNFLTTLLKNLLN